MYAGKRARPLFVLVLVLQALPIFDVEAEEQKRPSPRRHDYCFAELRHEETLRIHSALPQRVA